MLIVLHFLQIHRQVSEATFGEIDQQLLRLFLLIESTKEHGQKIRSNTNVCKFLQVFDSLHKRKMEQIHQDLVFPNKLIPLYRDTVVMVSLSDGDTNFFDIIAEVLQVNILTPVLFIIYLDYIIRTLVALIIENVFTLKRAETKRFWLRKWCNASCIE